MSHTNRVSRLHHRAASGAFALLLPAMALAPLACGPLPPPDDETEQRTGAWAQDLDGNPVGPNVGGAGDGGGGAGSGGGGSACSGGSAANLIAAGSYDYADHGVHTLTDGSFTLFLCITHFPLGSAARAEVEKAADLYNAVAGTSAHVEIGVAGHQDIDELFPDDPHASYMDVVDNSTQGFPCHDAGDTAPSSWVMNTCRHGDGANGIWKSGSSSIDHFVISVNPVGYAWANDPTSTDFPQVSGVLHELAHAFGMNHTGDWAAASGQALLSVMQGKLDVIPPHDRGYLRRFYSNGGGSTLNLMASPKLRLPDGGGDWSNVDFAAGNPTDLYVAADGNYYDCATRAKPVLQAQWFNNGQVATSCTVSNRFRIGPAGGEGAAAKVTVKEWVAAKMPAASQDRIASTVTIPEATLASLAKGVAYELTFKVDRDGAYAETDETDNMMKSTVTLRGSYFSCPGAATFNPL